MYSKVQRDRPSERPITRLVGSSPSRFEQEEPAAVLREPRAVIVESHPAVQAVLEHLLIREGYAVEVRGEAPGAAPGRTPGLTPGLTPVLLLVGAEDGDGLYVFQTRDVAGVLATLTEGAELPGGLNLPAFGIHAFLPKPFGILDILRVVRAVGGFDGRKQGPPREKSLSGGSDDS